MKRARLLPWFIILSGLTYCWLSLETVVLESQTDLNNERILADLESIYRFESHHLADLKQLRAAMKEVK